MRNRHDLPAGMKPSSDGTEAGRLKHGTPRTKNSGGNVGSLEKIAA